MRLYGVTSSSASDGGRGSDESGLMSTVDVTLVCLGFLLPLLKNSLLAVCFVFIYSIRVFCTGYD